MKTQKTPKKRLTLQDKAYRALKEAVRQVIVEHRKSGHPIIIWENGKVKRKYVS